jgi:hypothetical protein
MGGRLSGKVVANEFGVRASGSGIALGVGGFDCWCGRSKMGATGPDLELIDPFLFHLTI